MQTVVQCRRTFLNTPAPLFFLRSLESICLREDAASRRAEFPDIQVRQAWAEQNPEMVRDLIRALLKIHRDFAANPEPLYGEAAKRLALDPGLAK